MKISGLAVHPVKSCRRVEVERATVLFRGLRGDRRWMLVTSEGAFLTQREHGVLATLSCGIEGDTLWFHGGPSVEPSTSWGRRSVRIWKDTVLAYEAPGDISAWLTAHLGMDVVLVWMGPDSERRTDPRFAPEGSQVSFADGYPVLLASEASLKAVNARLSHPVPMGRFRPNFVVSGCGAFEEDTWRRIQVGDVVLDLVKPCIRCVILDLDPATGASSPGVLRVLGTFRREDGGVHFGQNAVPLNEGEVRVGDVVQVLETGPPRPALVPR